MARSGRSLTPDIANEATANIMRASLLVVNMLLKYN